ncbi:MAG: UDP-N-acetylmuramate--L-alanine ligase [Saprospiraceae bacterium]
MINFNNIKKAYFIGIGGIGMSAIARYFNSRDIEVFGYDRVSTKLTQNLENEGIKIHYEDDVTQIPNGIDLVVYTPAVPRSHSELSYFFDKNFPVLKRAAVLGIISKAKKVIGIAGTHGKTTTSTITTHLLNEGNVDISAFLGGIALNFESNFVEGNSDYVVAEADEFDRSFLHLYPNVAAIMSMDADHLDIYGNIETMHETFHQYVSQVQSGGFVFYKYDLPLQPTVNDGVKVQTFGVENGDFQSKNLRVEDGFFVFDLQSPIENIENLKFTLPGKHNIENATVAIAIAQSLGVSSADIRKGLLNFKGIKRRFEFVIRENNKVLIDDYAHHPTELNAAIDAARTLYPNKKITGVFQPHLFSRTKDFVDGFAESLNVLDEIVLLDIYPARELPIENVTSQIILDRITNSNKKIVSKQNLLRLYPNNDSEIILVLGAGDIDKLVELLKDKWLKIS